MRGVLPIAAILVFSACASPGSKRAAVLAYDAQLRLGTDVASVKPDDGIDEKEALHIALALVALRVGECRSAPRLIEHPIEWEIEAYAGAAPVLVAPSYRIRKSDGSVWRDDALIVADPRTLAEDPAWGRIRASRDRVRAGL